jgi:hypothetical protein
MYLHPIYAVTPEREALGVLDAWMWAREKRDAGIFCRIIRADAAITEISLVSEE